MKNLILNIYLRYQWHVNSKRSHAQRRHDQIKLLIKNCTSLEKLHIYFKPMIDDYEETFANEYNFDEHLASLNFVFNQQIKNLTSKHDYLIYS